jgi:hypothetical protein
MYSSSVQSLPTIDSYEAAQKYFMAKAKPPRSKRWNTSGHYATHACITTASSSTAKPMAKSGMT